MTGCRRASIRAPVPYFLIVFTLPAVLRAIAYQHKGLRKAMSSSMRCRSGDIGLVIGELLLMRSPHRASTPVTKR
jgi:hypothetical protein